MDSCRYGRHSSQINGLLTPPNLSDCHFLFPYKDGLNRALNVGQWPLQLGGSLTGSRPPTELTSGSFLGGIRDVVVNGELWNLVQHATGLNALPRHPECSTGTSDGDKTDKCAPNVSSILSVRIQRYFLTARSLI